MEFHPVRSPVLATQLLALNEVTALAIEDPYVRGVLAGILNDSYLVPMYKERELHISSAKAVIAIKDHEIYEIWSQFINRYARSRPLHGVKLNDPEILCFNSQFAMLLRYVVKLPPHVLKINTMKGIQILHSWLQGS